MPNLIVAPKGLEGVVVTRTEISQIDGEKGKLVIRGYDVAELASRLSFEEVAYLLWYGNLPSAKKLSDFKRNYHPRQISPPRF